MNGLVDERCDFYGCVIRGFTHAVLDISVSSRLRFVALAEEGIHDAVEFSCGDTELRLQLYSEGFLKGV